MRHSISRTAALVGALVALGGTSALAGGSRHGGAPIFHPPAVHSPMGGRLHRAPFANNAVRPAPMGLAGPRVYGGQVDGSGYGHGPAIYGVHGPVTVGGAAYGVAPGIGPAVYRRQNLGAYRQVLRVDARRHYGYAAAGAAVGGALSYGYGGDTGFADAGSYGYGSDQGSFATGYDEPAVLPAAAVAYPQQYSGGDDVQVNQYRAPFNPYRQAGYATNGRYAVGYGAGAYGGAGFSYAIPPAGGLAVYSPGAYGPGPRIIRIPSGYGTGHHCTCR